MKMERVVEAILASGDVHPNQHNNKGEAHAT
jgi:hypothetical protein